MVGADGLTVFRLPRSHWHAHLAGFDWSVVTPASLQELIAQFEAGIMDETTPHLLLFGKPGIGKSHLGVGVYRACCAALGTELCTWVNVPAFCERVKRSYGAGEADPWRDYEGARRLVVLDDLFGKDLTTHESGQIVTRLIDTAYQNRAAVLATMNPSVHELAARLHGHEISRLLANAKVVEMNAQADWRRKAT